MRIIELGEYKGRTVLSNREAKMGLIEKAASK